MFSKEDVLTVASALVNDCLEFECAGNAMRDYDKYYCIHCYYEMDADLDKKQFKHDLDCPVLVAKDLLTGNE